MTIEAQVTAIQTTLTALQTAVAAIAAPPAPTIDFTPVLTVLAGLSTQLTDIQAQLES